MMDSMRILVFFIIAIPFSFAASSYSHYAPCYINTTVASQLQNFPAHCILDTAQLISDGKMLGNCSDILVANETDDSKILYYEIENGTCNTTKTIIWIGIPNTSLSGNDIAYIFYGNATASDRQNATGLWRSALYSGVWHMSANDTLMDSAGYNNLAPSGSCTLANSRWGYGINFSGACYYMNSTAMVSLPNGTLESSMEIFSNFTSKNVNSNALLGFGYPSSGKLRVTFVNYNSTTGIPYSHIDIYGSGVNGPDVPISEDFLFSANWISGAESFWVIHNNSIENKNGSLAFNTGSLRLVVGADPNGFTAKANNITVTEIRISNYTRSEDWFRAVSNQKYSMGAEMETNQTETNVTISIYNLSFYPGVSSENININCSFIAQGTSNMSATFYFLRNGSIQLNSSVYGISNGTAASAILGMGNLSENEIWSCAVNLTNGSESAYSISSNSTVYPLYGGRWQPDVFSISNLRLNASRAMLSYYYPAENFTYKCMVDAFEFNDTEISSVSFEISGCGVNITLAMNESVGSQSIYDRQVWESGGFTPNSTGDIFCNAIASDIYETTLRINDTFSVTSSLGQCGLNDSCVISNATTIYPSVEYEYYDINVTSSGILANPSSSSSANYYVYADNDLNLLGNISISASTATYGAGNLYISAGNLFNQAGTIYGAGANGNVVSGQGLAGGNSLSISVSADTWNQSGIIYLISGNASNCTYGTKNGQAGGDVKSISFSGRSWISSGALYLIAANGGRGYAGSGGIGGDIDGISISGNFTKISGLVYMKQGAGGDAHCNGSKGGVAGGDSGVVKFITSHTGSFFFNSTSGITLVPGNGGSGKTCNASEAEGEGGYGGNGYFAVSNATDFYFNASGTINLTLGAGGNGNTTNGLSGYAGNGGSWSSSSQKIYCHGTCNVLSTIDLRGGAAGTYGQYTGTAGSNAAWIAYYNQVGAYNNFTYLAPARTLYNMSGTEGFARNATLQGNMSISSLPQNAYALEKIYIAWNRADSETDLTAITYEVMLVNQTSRKLMQNNGSMSIVLDTNRLGNGTWNISVREKAAYNRYSEWKQYPINISHAVFTSINGDVGEEDKYGNRNAWCNVSGYEYYLGGYNWEPNASTNARIYQGTIAILVENGSTNVSYQAEYDIGSGTYNATIGNLTAGTHAWHCYAQKANYIASYFSGNFTVNNFTVIYPYGVGNVAFACPYRTFYNATPAGQNQKNPIFTVVNRNSINSNYSISINSTIENISIYFSNYPNRSIAYPISQANTTACENVKFGNTTDCRIWLWADCVNASPASYVPIGFTIAEEK